MRRSLVPLLVIIALVLTGCGGDDDPTNAAAAGQDAGDGHDAHGGDGDPAAGARSVEVVATSFAFDPPTIRAGIGEDLAVELTSEDVEHDLTIDELDAHVGAEEGESAEGGFTPEEPGTYTYYCSVEGHREGGMEGTLTVE